MVTAALAKKDTSRGFNPKISLADSTGHASYKCYRLDGRLDAASLSPALHQSLLGMARLQNVVSSLRMEGESIELDQARKALDTKKASSSTELVALRLSEAYTKVSKGILPEFSVTGICQTHRTIFRNALGEGIPGALKTEQNYLLDKRTLRPAFIPTPPERTESELQSLFDWLKTNSFNYPGPVVAAVFFAEFQAIHPFVDGNGRLGRCLNLAILTKLGLRNAALVPLDTRLFRTHDKYYETLATTNTGDHYHLWIRYFVKQLESAYELALSRADLQPLIKRFSRPTTREVIQWIIAGDGTWFSRGEYPNPGGSSDMAIWSALRDLFRAGILEQEGDKRGRRYRLTSKFMADLYSRNLGGSD